MKPKFYVFYAYTLVAILLLPPVLSALADEILYEDNFTNLDPSWGTPSERLSVKDGKLTLKPAPNTTESILNQANVFDDADIRVEVNMPAGDVNVPGGLIFWAKDHSNFYCLCVDAAGYFKISRYVTDRWVQPVGWIENGAIDKGIGQVNKLRVVTKGRQAIAYINDKQVTTFYGQPPQGGGCIGVSGGSAENVQNTWQFTNLQVMAVPQSTALSTPAAPEPSPAIAETSAPASDSQPTPTSSPRQQQPARRVALRLHG